MNKINLNDKAKICYIAKFDNENKFLSLINHYSKDKNCDIIELRLDTIFEQERDVSKLITITKKADEIIKQNHKYSLATLRTKNDGSECDVDVTLYYEIIKELYLDTDVDLIDIEYRYYILLRKQFESLLNGEKTIILSFHEFKEQYNKEKIRNLLTQMTEIDTDVVKIAIFTHKKQEVFDLMEEAKKIEKKSKNNRFFVIIAMGKTGLVSRIYNEYTNTKIVYIDNDIRDIGPIGNVNIKKYYKLRKKIKELI